MAVLTTKARAALPTKSFAGPDRSYPIQDPSHARNALSRVSQFGSPELKAQVRAKVHAKYPSIGKKKMGSKAKQAFASGRMSKASADKAGYDTDAE